MRKNVTFSISGMHCVSCSLTIDGELEDMKGITSAKTNYAKAQTQVVFDSEEVDEKKIIALIRQTGYEAAVSS